MIPDYYHQTASLEVSTDSTDVNGNTIFESPVSIACRSKQKLQNVISPDGNIVTTGWVITTSAIVKAGDRINGRPVVGVSDYVSAGGIVVGKKVLA